ncbi:MAG: hypothetical protein AAF617_07410, partial [Bacteroidota bacterium]
IYKNLKTKNMSLIRSFLFVVACLSGVIASKFMYHLLTPNEYSRIYSDYAANGYATGALGLYILCGLCLLGLAITFLKEEA